MPSVTECDIKLFFPGLEHPTGTVNHRRGVYQPQQHQNNHHHQQQHINHHVLPHARPHYIQELDITEQPMHMQYMRETWVVHQREKFMNIMPGNLSFGVDPGRQSLHMIEQPVTLKAEMGVRKEDPVPPNVEVPAKKRKGEGGAPKTPKVKQPKKNPSEPKENGNDASQRLKPTKKNVSIEINGVDMDISSIPIPVCTCTGAPEQCYRWGCGGWQSACCTTGISVYPLPMSTKRRGARIAGRKMSLGAFKKVLEKLASEGYNFDLPIDMKSHWARHGTNKFVTIR